MNDSQNLGTVSTWQIKNFPDGLRKAIVDRAGVEKITVGELLTRITVVVMEADWQVDGTVNPSDTRQPRQISGTVNPSATRSTAVDLATVERAVAAAVALAGAPDVPITFRRRANRLLRESLPAPRVGSSKQPLRIGTNGAGVETAEGAHGAHGQGL